MGQTMVDEPGSTESSALRGRILVADDEKNIRRTLRMVLEGEGAEVLEAADGAEALAILGQPGPPIEVLVMDVMMPNVTGLEVLERLSAQGGGQPNIPVILISGHAGVEDAVRATRLGAFDFFEKPLDRDRVIVSVRNALRQFAADQQLRSLRSRIRGEIIGEGPATQALLAQIAKVGRTSWSPAPCTRRASAATPRSSRSTAPRSPASSSRASCSATSAAPSPAR
jgi:DNA-binding NtrC family response regulator